MSVNPEDWEVDFAFPNFNLAVVLMRTKLMQRLNSNLTEEENSSQCLKMLTWITIEDENELAEREISQKQLTSESFENDNKLTLKSFFAFCSGKMETISRQTQCPVSKILQRYIKELKQETIKGTERASPIYTLFHE